MRTYALDHLNNDALVRSLDAAAGYERSTMAVVIAHVGEVEARRLYLPAGYPSMYEFCRRRLRWSEQVALKRVRVARVARRFPAIFDALADGRLHLTAVILLATHLTPENADALLAETGGRTTDEIQEILARRFPRPDLPARVVPISRPLDGCVDSSVELGEAGVSAGGSAGASAGVATGASPGESMFMEGGDATPTGLFAQSLSARTVSTQGDTQTRTAGYAPRVTPLAAERYLLQCTIGKEVHDKLRRAQALLSHQVPSGDVAEVLGRALDVLLEKLEKRKFGAAAGRPEAESSAGKLTAGKSARTSRAAAPTAGARYIPVSVRQAVWERDGGRCTFVNAAGERCPARRMLEYDHVEPVACGGQATVAGLRLLCHGHNQYEAERRFGADFMNEKRTKALLAKTRKSAGSANGTRDERTGGTMSRSAGDGMPAPAPGRSGAPDHDVVQDLRAGLRTLGFRASEVRRAIESGGHLPDATLEERMRAALRFLCPSPIRTGARTAA